MERWLFCLILIAPVALAQNIIVDGQGTATLTWTPPTQLEDGTPIQDTDIQGYVIYYGDTPRANVSCPQDYPEDDGSSQCYGGSVSVPGGASSNAAVTLQLTESTTIYFAAVAQRTNGAYSTYSNEVPKQFTLVIDDQRPPEPPVIISIDISITCTTNDPNVTCVFNAQ